MDRIESFVKSCPRQKCLCLYLGDPEETLGSKDPVEIGRMVRKWNMEFLSSGVPPDPGWFYQSSVGLITPLFLESDPPSYNPFVSCIIMLTYNMAVFHRSYRLVT